jgi:hypothetical protein
VRQKKKRPDGRRHSSVVFMLLMFFAVPGATVVMVLMVATAVWGEPVRSMFEGSSEQVAYWPGVIGVQLRMTVPL